MQNSWKTFFFKKLNDWFGYTRALPPDDEVLAAIKRINAANVQTDAQIQKSPPATPPAKTVCVFFFAEGGSACAPGLVGGGCDKWGDYWHSMGRDGWVQTEPQCPPGSKVYKI